MNSSHYEQNDKETIELLSDMLTQEQYEGFILGNVIKYLARCNYKGTKEQDVIKAIDYCLIYLDMPTGYRSQVKKYIKDTIDFVNV